LWLPVSLIQPVQKQVRGRETLLIASFAFFALGLPTGAMSVMWPAIQRSVGASLAALGLLLAMWTLGYFAGSAGSGAVVEHVGVAKVLIVTAVLAAIGLLPFAAPTFLPSLIMGAVLLGIGTGGIGAAINAHVAVAQRVRWMGVIHTCWALGAAAGPLSVGIATRLGSWRLASIGIGLIFGVVAMAAHWRRNEWNENSPHNIVERRLLDRPNRLVTSAVLGAAFVYVGLECATGQWAYTRMSSQDLLPLSGLSISLYWGGLAVGRVALAAVGHWLSAAALLNLSTMTAFVGALGFWVLPGWLSPLVGLPTMGLGLSVFLPLLFNSVPHLCGARAWRTVGYQNAAGTAGGALIPGATGLLMQGLGVTSLNPWLVLLAGLMMAFRVVALAGSGRLKIPSMVRLRAQANTGATVATPDPEAT
jgi:fucose permease